MTVRKIPLQEHPPLDTGGRSLGETVASSFTSRIRDIVLADRTIHDLVGVFTKCESISVLVGSESVCIVCTRLF